MPHIIGVDIGGSHITAAIVDGETGEVFRPSLRRAEVDARAPAAGIIHDWCAIIQSAAGERPEALTIGLAMPGPFDYEEGICWINEQDKFRSLYGIDVRAALADVLKLPVTNLRFVNDAAAFLQGEVLYGAAVNAPQALGITLGTGFGSAVCATGRCNDANLWNAPFKDGIAEDYFSTRWFVKLYSDVSGIKPSGVREFLTVASEQHREIIFTEFSQNLSDFLLRQLESTPADVIVFGGNISKASSLFFPALKDLLAQGGWVGSVVQSVLGEQAALVGAAGCWKKMSDRSAIETLQSH